MILMIVVGCTMGKVEVCSSKVAMNNTKSRPYVVDVMSRLIMKNQETVQNCILEDGIGYCYLRRQYGSTAHVVSVY